MRLQASRTPIITGQRFSRWTVLGVAPLDRPGIHWLCRCDCGNFGYVRHVYLRKNLSRSCGCLANENNANRTRTDISGQHFGYLTALYPSGHNKHKQVLWRCRCVCGKEKGQPGHVLRTGRVKSCGCKAGEMKRRIIHGLSKTVQYRRFLFTRFRRDLRDRTPCWADIERIREIYDNCPRGYQVDHIIPIRGKLVSGLHVPENLQYLPAKENRKKWNHFEPIQAFGSLQLV